MLVIVLSQHYNATMFIVVLRGKRLSFMKKHVLCVTAKAGFMLERAVFETAIVRDTPMFRVIVF
jgi:hypothetical protein